MKLFIFWRQDNPVLPVDAAKILVLRAPQRRIRLAGYAHDMVAGPMVASVFVSVDWHFGEGLPRVETVDANHDCLGVGGFASSSAIRIV